MPLPLAHPAAVLPLRRYCPRLFSFSALVVGSLVPDLGYCFPNLRLDVFSHTWKGSFGFCLPVGIISMLLLWMFRTRFVQLLPQTYRKVFLAVSQHPLGSPMAILLSFLVGTWTHLFFDAMTHKYSPIFGHDSLLRFPLVSIGSRTVKLHHILWYAFSFAGVFWVCLSYQRWRSKCGEGQTHVLIAVQIFNAFLFAGLALLIGLMHHTVPGALGDVLAAAGSLLLLAGAVWRIR